jgi:hypothetical protein
MLFKDKDNRHLSEYYRHLAGIGEKVPHSLWKYFSCDSFFHDGEMKDFQFDKTLSKISFKISTPNVKKFKNEQNGEFDYVNVDFLCCIENIYLLEVKNLGVNNCDYLWENLTFLYSEIDTYKGLEAIRKNGSACNSLSIKADNGANGVILHIVFEYISIYPREPLAFSIIESSDDYELPKPQRKSGDRLIIQPADLSQEI